MNSRELRCEAEKLSSDPNIYAPSFSGKIFVSFRKRLYANNGNLNEACSGPQRLGARVRGKPELHVLFHVI
jgi:hypothetical protein